MNLKLIMEREGYSGLSITALIFSIVGFLFLLAWFTGAAIGAPNTLVGIFIFGQFLMNLIGLGTGIPSLFTTSKKRLLGILGVVISTSTFLITLSMIIIGLTIMEK